MRTSNIGGYWRCSWSRRHVSLPTVLLTWTILASGCSSQSPIDNPSSATVPYTDWVSVGTGDIVERLPYDGLVVPANPVSLTTVAMGTVTRLPAVGSLVHSGQALVFLDEIPVLALAGEIPVYRDIVASASGTLEGDDVGQVQIFLTSVGYFTGPINGRFTADLGASIRAWRLDNGLGDVRGFTQSELIFVPGQAPWTVIEIPVARGQEFAGGVLLNVSSGGVAVAVALDAPPAVNATYALVPSGGGAGVTVPLTPIGEAVRGEDGKYALKLLLPEGNLTLQSALGSSVIVEQNVSLATEVITMPVSGIRLSATGQAVARCRAGPGSSDRECSLDLGVSDGTDVEVRSGLTPGMQVAVAP